MGDGDVCVGLFSWHGYGGHLWHDVFPSPRASRRHATAPGPAASATGKMKANHRLRMSTNAAKRETMAYPPRPSHLAALAWLVAAPAWCAADGCDITAFGAVPGNITADAARNAAAIQRAIATPACGRVTVPGGVFKIAPIRLLSDKELYLEAGATLVGSDQWQDYLPAGATNVSITGRNGTIDGNGWFAWPSANWSSPECGMAGHCQGPTLFGPDNNLKPPHVVTLSRCSGTAMSNVTVTNPPYWGVQHFFCNDTQLSQVTILAPRWTREIAVCESVFTLSTIRPPSMEGLMPFSVLGYTVTPLPVGTP
eukprot:gene8385-1498_t